MRPLKERLFVLGLLALLLAACGQASPARPERKEPESQPEQDEQASKQARALIEDMDARITAFIRLPPLAAHGD